MRGVLAKSRGLFMKKAVVSTLLSFGVTLGASISLVSAAPQLRSNPLAGVYHPWRLEVIKPFVTVTGIVERIRREPDHDFHINLRLDSKYASMINDKNRQYESGDLVVEVIPMDANRVPVPYVGEHISVSGSYVLDKDHGWMEVHPAWYFNGKGSAQYTAAAATASVKEGIDGNDETFGNRQSTTTHHVPTTTTTKTGSSSPAGLSIVSFTKDVYPGAYATLEMHTKPGAEADIEVDYASGPSHAKGLNPQNADRAGDVTWTWRVGTKTTPGNWAVIVTSLGKTLTTKVNVQ